MNLLRENFTSRGKQYDYLVFDKLLQAIICRSNNYFTLCKKYKEQRYEICMKHTISYRA